MRMVDLMLVEEERANYEQVPFVFVACCYLPMT
jgi:hypothetical protein